MSKENNGQAIGILKKYKHFKTEVNYINIEIEELNEELGPAAISYSERGSLTYKITSSTENEAERLIEKKDKLIKSRNRYHRAIRRVDNALNLLNESEYDVIHMRYREDKSWAELEVKLKKTYPRLQQIKKEAIKKIAKYIKY